MVKFDSEREIYTIPGVSISAVSEFPQMNMSNPLIPGTIQDIYEKGANAVDNPFLQIIHLKSFEKDVTSTRYKIVLSDSKNFMQGTLATNLNNLVDNKIIELNSIVRLVKYGVNSIKNHRLVFVAEIGTEDVVKGMGRVGEPTNIDNPTVVSTASASNTSTATPFAYNNTTSAPVSNPANSYSAPSNNAGFKPSSSTVNGNNANTNNSAASSSQPISSLSPYKDRSVIKARVTSKTEVKKWTNDRGEGRLFSVSLLDSSGEIRLTCFNDSVDQYFDLLQVGKVYEFANFQVKIAKRQYGSIQNDYEIAVDSNTTIKAVLDEIIEIPEVLYSFVPISKMVDNKKDDIVDVIGIVKECGELSEITVKSTQKQLTKRDLTLVDTSSASIRLTLWGKQAQEFTEQEAASKPVIAIKGVKVNEYQGKTLSSLGSSQITFNPDMPEAHTLRGWFDSKGGEVEAALNVSSASANSANASNNSVNRDERKFLSQVKDESLGQHDKPDYFNTVASVSFVKSENGNISYMACPTEGCNKKVIEEGPNQYRCEKCQKVFDRCDHRYIMTVQISDSTGALWVQAFNETGHQLLDKSAEEMYQLKMNVS